MSRLYLVLVSLLVMLLSGCGDRDTQEHADRAAVNRQQAVYAKGQPVPAFDWSLERDLVAQLYEMRNKRLTTHSVWRANTGFIEGDCPSVGFGIPFDTSMTNPYTYVLAGKRAAGWGPIQVGQAEPNGIFQSQNTTATWVMCVIEEGGRSVIVPLYIETKVTAYPYAVNVDYDKNRVTRVTGSKPSAVIEKRKPKKRQPQSQTGTRAKGK